jgi:hypothetical protein
MSASRPYVIKVALVLTVAAAVVAVDRSVAPPEPDVADPAQVAAEHVGGSVTCPVGDGRDGTRASVSAIGPGAGEGGPGLVELGAFGDGTLSLNDATRLLPYTAERTTLDADGEIAAFAHFYDGPVAVHREWQLAGEEDLPPGIAAGPCVAGSSDRWLVPGMSTAGGHEARLRLANPYETDATVAIRLVTPEGPVEPTVLQNLTVQGRSTAEIEVNEHLPERDDVAAEIHVLNGRMVAEGYQLVRQAIGDVDGVSLLASAEQPSTEWTVPWVAHAEDRQSWLWLLNPGERPAPVELTLHGGDGGLVPDGLAEVTVEPGQLRRIDLRGTFPDNLTSAAVTVRSDGAPVVASGVVRQEAGDAEDTGMAVQLGARPDTDWVLAGGETTGRSNQVRLINPGSEPAVVDVVLYNGQEVGRLEALSGIEVGPGALVPVDLSSHLGQVESWAAFVVASEGSVVAGHVGRGGEGSLDLVAGPAIPGAAWDRVGPAVVGRHLPGLTQRTGTQPPGGRPDETG